MLLKGDVKSNKFELLVENFVSLVNSGVPTSEILVLLQTPNDKKKFINLALEKINISVIEKLNIHTFSGLIYNTICDNWYFLETAIPTKKHHILPNLVGLEVSQLILKDILKDIKVKGYNSKKSLLHQLFRRLSLILQNNLTEEEVKQKSEILKEAFAEDANIIIKSFLAKTLSLRSFDYLRQTPLFKYIYQNTDYFKNIKYLILNDADEITPFMFAFLETLELKDYCIAYDNIGNARSGYLAADFEFEENLKKIFNTKPKILSSKSNKTSEKLFLNILENQENILSNLEYKSLSKRAEMVDEVNLQIQKLIQKGVTPSEISIIAPMIDPVLKSSLSQKLNNHNLVFISGSEKLIDDPIVKSIINIIKMSQGIIINEFEKRAILLEFLQIPIHELNNQNNEKFAKLTQIINELKDSNEPLSYKIFYIYKELLKTTALPKLQKFNFFLKQIQDFEKVFSTDRTEDIINQIENSIISENPYSTLSIKPSDLIVSTPQKIIDNKITTKYQFWLDTTSSEWTKSDTGPLYNSWVFQKNWTKSEYTIEDDIYLSKQKTAKILRKLSLCTDYIFAFSSLFDFQGVENFGGIGEYLITEVKQEDSKPKFNIIPRDDQKPVLEYKRGAMAISAVPGAGKTTILLALIIKLIENNIKPENIYVLTYMESAARNFKDKIKNINPNSSKIPNITTIHGLALRILKENSNYEKLGLDPNFDICDDSLKLKIISSVANGLGKDDLDDFVRAISVMKFSKISNEVNSTHPKVRRFLKFYHDYQTALDKNNLIDYDDILVSSVKLLEENKDVLAYYQNICKYIIEDEAQDSSSVQQRLLNLLSGKYKNIIRCGDINQAITTTFTNADVEGFYKFINNSDKVSMDRSQRCTQEVWTLANRLVDFGKEAFYYMKMRPVEGRNPVQKNALFSQVFQEQNEEKNFVLKEIKTLLSKKPDATIGILLRNNYQVSNWESFIDNAGFKVITRSESLGKKAIFKTIFAILKAVENPWNNSVLSTTYQTLYEQGFYKKNLSGRIDTCEEVFITKDPDEVGELGQFIWDINYWILNSTLPLSEFVSKIGLYYYNTDIEVSNVYLISILTARLNVKNDLSLLIEKFEELSKRPSLSGFKFFNEEDTINEQTGTIQIMTMHKSKGDEFDYVFIPELSEKNLTLDINEMKIKSSTTFMESIKELDLEYKKKTDIELKQFQISESFRLLYVAITRAKRKLYITTSEKSKSFNRVVTNAPSIIFEKLLY